MSNINRVDPKIFAADLLRIQQDTNLSALAKVILTIALLQDNSWDCTVEKLVCLCKEGRDAILTALRELETQGYLCRSPLRKNGRYAGYTYTFWAAPHLKREYDNQACTAQYDAPKTSRKRTISAAPEAVKSIAVIPETVEPETDVIDINNINITQKYNDRLIETKDINISISTNQSINQDPESVKAMVTKQIDMIHLRKQYDCYHFRHISDIAAIMVDIYMCNQDTYIAGRDVVYPTDYIQACIRKIGPCHVQQIIDNVINGGFKIVNPKGYFVRSLVNSSQTMDLAYDYGSW